MPRRSRVVLAVFIDAFGWRILRSHGFLEDVLTRKAPLGTMLGYSSTCDPTILTGALPRDHQHFSFYYYDPDNSPFRAWRFLSFLPRFATDRGRVRHWMSRAVARVHGFTGYFELYNVPFDVLPLMDYSEKRDIYQPGGIIGRIPTVFDYFREKEIPFFLSDWRVPEIDNIQGAGRALENGTVRFAYLFLGGLDGVLHEKGTRADEVGRKIAWYEKQIRTLLKTARARYDDVRVHVFSDHGMADVTGLCDLMSRIEGLGLRYGRDYAAVYDSTMARFWFLREGARERISGVLEDESCGRMLTDEELVGYGCDFPGSRYGEMFFLAHPGTIICPSYMGLRPIAGMHGYDPDHEDSIASYSTNTADCEPPRDLTDLAGLFKKEVTI
ncbi:MAG: hypothetical protein GXP54_06215 [Deltaproteobacteria bacterium]|nr:hypothetical protein [Deltaproteobacteria bacterium]